MAHELEAASGAAVFNAYAHNVGAYPFHNQPETMAKLLRDLMQYADDWNIDFAACVDQARLRFEHDRNFAHDEARDRQDEL